LDANPQVRADLEGIKQPAVAFLDRCGYANPLDNPWPRPAPPGSGPFERCLLRRTGGASV